MPTTTFGGQVCYEARSLLRYCAEHELPTAWAGKPNSFRTTLGEQPGLGWVLMTERGLATLGSLDRLYDLTFALDPAEESGLPGRFAVTITDLLILRTECLAPSTRGHPDNARLVHLADQRYLWRRVPIDKGYNVVSSPGGYVPATLNGSAAWTWTEMIGDLWVTVGKLGAYPGLPLVPDGTPTDFQFWGMSSWAALNTALRRIGCQFRLHPFTGACSIVQDGAEDRTAENALATWDRYRIWDSDPQESIRGRIPAAVRVLFRKTPAVPGVSPWYELAINDPTAFAVATGFEPATVVDLPDDLEATYDSLGTLTNAAALASRAQEKADDYYRQLWRGWARLQRTYPMPLSEPGLLPGSRIRGIGWGDVGTGMKTEVGRFPDALVAGMEPLATPEEDRYWWLYQPGGAGGTGSGGGCLASANVYLPSIVPDTYGMLTGWTLILDGNTMSWAFSNVVKLVDANNLRNAQLSPGRVYGGIYADSKNGYCVYAASCCDTPAIILPPPIIIPPPIVPPPSPCPVICTSCPFAPYFLAVTLTGFSGGATIGPATGGCAECDDTPTQWAVDLTGFSGFLAALELGPQDLLVPSVLAYCEWQYVDFSSGVPISATLIAGGPLLTFAIMGGVGDFVRYTAPITAMDCCSPIDLAFSDTTGSPGEYPLTLTFAPTCTATPTDGCSQADVGAITPARIADCTWAYADSRVSVYITFDGSFWTQTTTTPGGCVAIHRGAGDCCLTGGVEMTLVMATGTAPATLTLRALSACDNCAGLIVPPPVPGTIEVPCCTGTFLSNALRAILSNVSNMECLDGVAVVLNFENGSCDGGLRGGWHGSAVVVCGDPPAPTSIDLTLCCPELAAGCTDFELFVACNNQLADTWPVTGMTCTCVPFSLTANNVGLNMTACVGAAGTPALIDILITE